MPEQTKIEPLSATECEVDFSKIDFDGLTVCKQEDEKNYVITTGILPIELISF